MDLDIATILRVEVMTKSTSKKMVNLSKEFFLSCPDHESLWLDFKSNLGNLKLILASDSRQIDLVNFLLVQFVGCSEKVSIYKEHFLAFPAACELWNTFAERKFDKRDFLKSLEKPIQKMWEAQKVFEVDAQDSHEEKWLGTFPYPYMNGALHLGHAATIVKVDFQTAFQRLKGKHALFPFSFHCTGMPIKACADKLAREKLLFENEEPVVESTQVTESSTTEVVPVENQRRVSAKAAQKGSKEKSQWEIMASLDIPDHEIYKFCEAKYWLEYFPPRCQKDLIALGTKNDWRRSFITTDCNPYYDAFIQWQFEKLRKMGKIIFGKRATVYSPFDGQPCLDHDRRSGEKLGVSEYTIIKLEVLHPYPDCLKMFENSPQKIYMAAATLRPETMYGQTNCWILPTGQYGAYQVSENEIFVLTARAARNYQYQGEEGQREIKELATFEGKNILGTAVRAPLSKYPQVYVLPMLTISDKKTTGVVTSVPSDSPDDFAALNDLKTKSGLREKYGITLEMCQFDPIPIIDIPNFSNLSAVKVVNEMKIKSQNEKELLAEAKDICYKRGFYEGIMLEGEFAGQTVQDAKKLVKSSLIEKGLACTYYEPEGEVISRSGDVCVVSLCDQWYINYGEESWKQLAIECVDEMSTYDSTGDVKTQLKAQLQITHQWACSRSFGLGTKIPWDKQYIIESLSDSTIYMAYYSIAHILQGDGNYYGRTEESKIKPEDLTYEVFEYIFANGPLPTTPIPSEVLDKCVKEFSFWYPLDVRITGKDLLPNHMIFWIYNHVALFPKEKWPKGLKGCGWLLLNGEKMSKSTGNFITIKDAVKYYGADASRFAFTLGGDTLDDPNFTIENVETAILSIYNFVEWLKDIISIKDSMRNTEELSLFDKIFESEMNILIQKVDSHYSNYDYRDVINFGFFDMLRARDEYRNKFKSNDSMNWVVIKKFIYSIVTILAPVASHTCEFIWSDILKENGSIFNASFPVAGIVDEELLLINSYIGKVLNLARSKDKSDSKRPRNLKISYASEFPDYYKKMNALMREYYLKNKLIDGNTWNFCKNEIPKEWMKKSQKAFGEIKSNFSKFGEEAFEKSLLVCLNEKRVLEENRDFIKSQLSVNSIEIIDEKNSNIFPGVPSVQFYLVNDS